MPEGLDLVHNIGPVILATGLRGIFEHDHLPLSLVGRTENKGFGPTVAKRIASIHSGFVWATSSEAMGTTFFADIPAALQGRTN